MIIRMDWPLANNHPEGPASCEWSSRSTIFFSIFLFILQQIYYHPPINIIFSFKAFRPLLQILGSKFNLADISRTTCSCFSSCWLLNCLLAFMIDHLYLKLPVFIFPSLVLCVFVFHLLCLAHRVSRAGKPHTAIIYSPRYCCYPSYQHHYFVIIIIIIIHCRTIFVLLYYCSNLLTNDLLFSS